MENNIMHKERSDDLLTCFISAPAGVNLSKIRHLLSKKGLELHHPSEIAPYGQISEKISELISQADLFLAVFDKSYESGNTFFELGIATAQRKQIIILSPPNFELPSDLAGFLFLRADADNIEALGFAIDQLLEAPIIKKKKRHHKKSSIRTKPSTVKSIDLLEKFNLLSQGVTGYKLESFVTEMLKESGVSIVRQSESPDYGADFAIWSDDLGTILGNPILIEIKKSIRSHDQVKQITNQLTGCLQKTNSRSALVLYLEGIPSREAQSIARVFNIFFFQIGEFVQQIQDRSFVDVIRTRRNIVAHGGEV